jgi:hypothetical protein
MLLGAVANRMESIIAAIEEFGKAGDRLALDYSDLRISDTFRCSAGVLTGEISALGNAPLQRPLSLCFVLLIRLTKPSGTSHKVQHRIPASETSSARALTKPYAGGVFGSAVTRADVNGQDHIFGLDSSLDL